MQKCSTCRADIPANAQFCSRCGTSVDGNQALSAPLDEAQMGEEDLETTSKQPVVTVPASPDLPTLRTRRMHPQSSIPEFSAQSWFSYVPEDDVEGTLPAARAGEQQGISSPVLQIPLTPPIETLDDAPHIPETPSQALPTGEEAPASDGTEDAASHATAPLSEATAPDAFEPVGEATPSASEHISTFPTDPLPYTPALLPDEIATSPTGDLVQAPALDDIATSPTDSLAPTGELKYVSPFPPPTPERRSTPRPMSTTAQPRRRKTSLLRKKGAANRRIGLVILLVALVILAGGIGTFALLRPQAFTAAHAQCTAQNTSCAGGSPVIVRGHPTRLTFAGSLAGPMTIIAKPRCQIASAGNLRVLTLNLSGTINDQLYNLGFAIGRYHGPGTYSSTAATITILFDAPGQSTTNGWGNSAPTDTGSITVEGGEQTGSISYTLSGFGTQANTQIQASGNWTCGG